MANKIKYGVQMFGCSADFRKDTEYFFSKMQEFGYTIIEPCIMFDDPEEFKAKAMELGNPNMARLPDLIWTAEDTPKFVEDMKRYDLEILSAHIFGSDYKKMMPKMKEVAKATGLKAYVINTPQAAVDDPVAFADVITYVASELSDIGVELWLHNSGADFRKKVEADGEEMFVYEYLLTKSKGAFAQVDTGWVMAGKTEPQDFMKKYIDVLKCIHFKDLHENFDEIGMPGMFAVLGEGRTDVEACLSVEPEDNSLPVIIDQDMPISGDIFADLKKSIDLLHSLEK